MLTSSSPSGRVSHPHLGEVNWRIDVLPEDADGQVAATVDRMRHYAVEDAGSPEIRQAAVEVRQMGGGGRPEDVFAYVKGRVGFQLDEEMAAPFGDPDIIEVLIRPRDMHGMQSAGGGTGDCDDFVMYGASILLALGCEVSFVTVAADPRDPERFSHVYLAAYGKDGTRTPLDISHGDEPGWEVTQEQQVYRFTEWPVKGGGGMLVILAAAAAGAYLLCH